MSSRGNIIFTIFGNSFITQDYTEKSKKIQSENIIGVRYVQLSGNMDYDDRMIVVPSFLASEIDLIWSFTMKKYLLTHLVLRRQVWSKKYCFPILLFLFFWKAKNKYLYCFIYFIQQTVLTPARIRLCLEMSGRRWRRILHWYNFSQRPDPHTYTAATWGSVASTFDISTERQTCMDGFCW